MGRNSAAPLPPPLRRSLSFGSLLAGIFDDQDRVLGSERDQENEADLRVKVVGGDADWLAATLMAPSVVTRDCPEQSQRHAQDHREGQIELSYWPARTK